MPSRSATSRADFYFYFHWWAHSTIRTRYDFFRADACPEEIAVKREAAFNAMQQQWDEKWPKSIEFGHSLRAVFSVFWTWA